jgi:hypothetical protein
MRVVYLSVSDDDSIQSEFIPRIAVLDCALVNTVMGSGHTPTHLFQPSRLIGAVAVLVDVYCENTSICHGQCIPSSGSWVITKPSVI